MIRKEKIIAELENLPDQFPIEEFIEKLIFLEKLDLRISESENDQVIDDELVNKEIEGWFK